MIISDSGACLPVVAYHFFYGNIAVIVCSNNCTLILFNFVLSISMSIKPLSIESIKICSAMTGNHCLKSLAIVIRIVLWTRSSTQNRQLRTSGSDCSTTSVRLVAWQDGFA